MKIRNILVIKKEKLSSIGQCHVFILGLIYYTLILFIFILIS